MSFLIERLSTNSRQIKEIALNALLQCGYKPEEEEKGHLRKIISDTFGLLVWMISARVCLNDENDKILLARMDKEYARWRAFLLNLLVLTYGKSITPVPKAEKKSDDISLHIAELADIIYSNVSSKQNSISDIEADKKRLGKLQFYFPCTVPRYETLLEDIINCDYNIINIWTKVCAVRNITEFGNEHIRESVVALFFSPEWILKEEAARLIAGAPLKDCLIRIG
jgi:hypothetical protein